VVRRSRQSRGTYIYRRHGDIYNLTMVVTNDNDIHNVMT